MIKKIISEKIEELEKRAKELNEQVNELSDITREITSERDKIYELINVWHRKLEE